MNRKRKYFFASVPNRHIYFIKKKYKFQYKWANGNPGITTKLKEHANQQENTRGRTLHLKPKRLHLQKETTSTLVANTGDEAAVAKYPPR